MPISRDPGELPALEASILEHMNRDHRDALIAIVAMRMGIEPQQAEMIAIDCDGFDVRSDDRMLRFKFEQPSPPDSKRELR